MTMSLLSSRRRDRSKHIGSFRLNSRSLALPALCLALLAGCTEPPPPPLSVTRVVRTQTIAQNNGNEFIELAGDVRAQTEIRLAFRVGGKLIARDVEVGQIVKRGQVLARLDPSDLRSGLAAADAQVQAAEVKRAQAEADLKRFLSLRSKGFISDAEIERHQANFKAADAQHRQALAQKELSANRTRYTRLRADAEGVVVAVDAEIGAVLAAGQPLVRIARNGVRDVVFSVPEDRRDWVLHLRDRKIDLPVALWGSDKKLTARIREVAAAADSVSRTFLVRAKLSESNLAPGQTATVDMPLPGRSGALVPMNAVFERAGNAHVWVVDGKPLAVRAVPVSVEPATSKALLVNAGLPNGATIVTAGVHVLNDGEQVRLAQSRVH